MILALLLAAQTAKLPPWNPIPMDGSAEAAVMAPINAMFAGLEARNGAAIIAQTRRRSQKSLMARVRSVT